MSNHSRKVIIAGNWKMNKTREEARTLVENLKNIINNSDSDNCEIIICAPFTNLETVIKVAEGSNIKIAAQNCHFEDSGAFTGEISPIMLKEMGVEYVIIGHSERRQYFAETDVTINKKIIACLNHGIKPILCVGETLEERELNITEEVISKQIKVALNNVSIDNIRNVVIAYEPVWAIGTGKTSSAEQANEVCKHIRNILGILYNKEVANSITIQYGGSMNPSNANELLVQPDIDGGLIGGASLKVSDFSIIINATSL